MLHGAFCGGWAFDGWRQAFAAAGYDAFAPTLPYHDVDWPAERPPEELARQGLRAYTDYVTAFIDALDAPPILIGHSLGGLIAQLVAAERAVAAVVLLSPSAPWGVMPSSLREALTPAAIALTVGPYWLRTISPEYSVAMESCLHNLPKRRARAAFDRFVPESGLAVFETWHWTWDPRRASWVDPRAIKAPVLIAVGADDRVNSPRTAASLAQRYRLPSEHLQIHDGHAHWLLSEPGWERIVGDVIVWAKAATADVAERAGVAP